MKRRYLYMILTELMAVLVLVAGWSFKQDKENLNSSGETGFAEKVKSVNAQTKDMAKSGQKSQIEPKKVALTFDDGPNECYTQELLDGLASRGVKATFFLIGKKVEESPEIVKRIYEEGHLIGNHSYDHVNLSEMSKEDACEQIDETNDVIKQVTGVIPEYLRPPFGSYKENLDTEMNMIEVLWDVDPRDWSVKNTGEVVNRVIQSVNDGDIILLHDEYATSVVAAMEIIDILQGQGYEFVTVDEMLFD